MRKRKLSFVLFLCMAISLLSVPILATEGLRFAGAMAAGTAKANASLYSDTDAYTVTFLPNGGTGSMSAVTVPKGDDEDSHAYVLPASGFKPPAGMHFAGWKADNEESLVTTGYTSCPEICPPGLVVYLYDSVNFTAQWGPGERYTISFAGSGYAYSGEMEPITVSVGETITLPKNQFKWGNCRFAGWALYWRKVPDNWDVVYTDEAVIQVSSDVTLYPRYIDDMYEYDAPQYPLTISPTLHGKIETKIDYGYLANETGYTVTPEGMTVRGGADVSIIAIPDEGYHSEIAVVTAEYNLPVIVTQSRLSEDEQAEIGNTDARINYFDMPPSNVTVSVSFVSGPPDDDIIDQGYCGAEGTGRNVSWKRTKDGTLEVSGTGKMETFFPSITWLRMAPWSMSNVKAIQISEGVTNVSDFAFWADMLYDDNPDSDSWHKLEVSTIDLGSSVKVIGISTFSHLTTLTSIKIPSSVTTIRAEAFEFCKSLKDVYYGGTKAQWDEIEIDPYCYPYEDEESFAVAGNKPLLNAVIHCIDDVEESAIVPGSIQRVPLTSGKYAAALDYSGAGLDCRNRI